MRVLMTTPQTDQERQELGNFLARTSHDVSANCANTQGVPPDILKLLVQLVARDPSTGELLGGIQLMPDADFAGAYVRSRGPGAVSAAAAEKIYRDCERQIRLLSHVAVASEARGENLGQTLVNEACGAAYSTGATFVYGFADGDLDGLKRFYSKCGFVTNAVDEPLHGAIPGPLGEITMGTNRHGFWFHTGEQA